MEQTEIPNINADIARIPALFKKPLVIPEYQRPYRWQSKNVLQLLNDILHSENAGSNAYRLGTVILHQEDDKLKIVDGQQRLVTLTLALLTLQDRSSPLIKAKFDHIDSKDNIKNNSEVIQQWLRNLREDQRTSFLKYIREKCEFVVIELHDISEAFQLFDSQNARGKALEPYDLLKAFHLREMDQNTEEEQRTCAVQWQRAVDKKQLDYLGKYIYRIRKWARQEDAGYFTKDDIDEFKGVNLSEHKDYPYLRAILLNDAVVNQLGKNPLSQSDGQYAIFPFQLTQVILNGKRFFEFIAYYSELFSNVLAEDNLLFGDFYKKHCLYPGNTRTGDVYVRELFKASLLFHIDKYGTADFEKVRDQLYRWSYILRLKQTRVMYTSVDKYLRDSTNIFKNIERSYHPHEVKLNSIPRDFEKPYPYPIPQVVELFNK